MNDNEKLIEEARRWATRPDEYQEDALIVRLADALEAAEKESNPTDDEREVLATILATWRDGEPEAWAVDMYFEPADLIIAAGFHRSDALERARRGARTLGEIVDRQVEDMLRWAGMEDQIGTDDPDQQLAWELCAEMPGRIKKLEAEIAALRAAGGAR